MMSSLLSMLGTHDPDDMARTLLAMSSSPDSCAAMRQSGCVPLLIQLLYSQNYDHGCINWGRWKVGFLGPFISRSNRKISKEIESNQVLCVSNVY